MLLIRSVVELQAQQPLRGCTDPAARNYDTLARINDGSCRYAPERKDPHGLFRMPEGLEEQSGMVWWNGLLWIHNDGGARPELLGIDSPGPSTRRNVTLRGAPNLDRDVMSPSDT